MSQEGKQLPPHLQAKKEFVLSLKRALYFFNNMKDYNEGLEKRANLQSCDENELNEKVCANTTWMEEATKVITESKRFVELIESQEK